MNYNFENIEKEKDYILIHNLFQKGINKQVDH